MSKNGLTMTIVFVARECELWRRMSNISNIKKMTKR